MAPAFRILEIEDLPDGKFYLTVAFWEDDDPQTLRQQPFLIEDFVVRSVPEYRVPPDEWGRLQRPDGSWEWPHEEVDGVWHPKDGPWRTYRVPLRAHIRRMIRTHIGRVASNEGYVGDRTSKRHALLATGRTTRVDTREFQQVQSVETVSPIAPRPRVSGVDGALDRVERKSGAYDRVNDREASLQERTKQISPRR